MDAHMRIELLEAVSKFKKFHSSIPSPEDLSHGEFFMLKVIEKSRKQKERSVEQGVKISDLSAVMHMSKPGISQMLKSLENKKMIRRVMAQDDRRVIYVVITELGYEMMEKASQLFQYYTDQILKQFGEENTKKLIELLNRLYEITQGMK